MQWLVRRNSSLMSKSRKRFSTRMFMCWLPSGSTERVPPPNVPRDEQALPPPVVEARQSSLPSACEQTLQDGTLCSAAFPTKVALAAHQTHFKKHARGAKRCVASALVCGNQCCHCRCDAGEPSMSANTSSKIPCDEVFVEPRLPKEAQRGELLKFLLCLVLSVVRSCQKMVRHLLTWLHIFAHSSHMAIWSTNHLCLRVRCCFHSTRI